MAESHLFLTPGSKSVPGPGPEFEALNALWGYQMGIKAVLADCRADGDEEVHRLLTTKIFPRHADVLMLDDWNKISQRN